MGGLKAQNNAGDLTRHDENTQHLSSGPTSVWQQTDAHLSVFACTQLSTSSGSLGLALDQRPDRNSSCMTVSHHCREPDLQQSRCVTRSNTYTETIAWGVSSLLCTCTYRSIYISTHLHRQAGHSNLPSWKLLGGEGRL